MKRKYHLTPLNELQELNYTERHFKSRSEVETRALEIIRGLEKALPMGTFACQIECFDPPEEWIVKIVYPDPPKRNLDIADNSLDNNEAPYGEHNQ